jgi:chemotaxis protein methyltransferase CheR
MPSSTARPLGSVDVIDEVSRVVTEITGVQLGEQQRAMVQNRLMKRCSELGLASEREYADYFRRNRDSETQALVSLLTTHHTYFFREFAHFEYLADHLPELVQTVRARGDKTLRIWSAACSRGQEAYSLAMLLAAYLPRLAPELTVQILGTDVDSESVAVARNGVYKRREIVEIPQHLAADHWARGSGAISDFVRAKAGPKPRCAAHAASRPATS